MNGIINGFSRGYFTPINWSYKLHLELVGVHLISHVGKTDTLNFARVFSLVRISSRACFGFDGSLRSFLSPSFGVVLQEKFSRSDVQVPWTDIFVLIR